MTDRVEAPSAQTPPTVEQGPKPDTPSRAGAAPATQKAGRDRPPSAPSMERVTLRGGPLDGLVRHVRRNASRTRFQRPLGDGRYWYERAEPGVWRYVEP